MTTFRPPALAVALLEHLSTVDDDLLGDLMEEFEGRRSRLWFWRQTLAAAIAAPFRARREPRPLKLVDEADRGAFESRLPQQDTRRRAINLGVSPVSGIGGLGLAFLFGLTLLMPRIWLVALIVAGAGVLLGLGRIWIRQHDARR